MNSKGDCVVAALLAMTEGEALYGVYNQRCDKSRLYIFSAMTTDRFSAKKLRIIKRL